MADSEKLPDVKPAPKPAAGKGYSPKLIYRGGPEGYTVQDLAYSTRGPLVNERETSKQLSADYDRTKGRRRGRIPLRGSQR